MKCLALTPNERGYKYTQGAFPLLCSDKQPNLRDSQTVKIKAYSYAFTCMPTPLPSEGTFSKGLHVAKVRKIIWLLASCIEKQHFDYWFHLLTLCWEVKSRNLSRNRGEYRYCRSVIAFVTRPANHYRISSKMKLHFLFIERLLRRSETPKEKIVMPFHEIETAFRRRVTILGILL